MEKLQMVWNKPEKILEADKAIMFKEILSPGSIWSAYYSDMFVLCVNEDSAMHIPSPVPGTVKNFIKIREEISQREWSDLQYIGNTKALNAAFAHIDPKIREDLIKELLCWKRIERGSLVLLTKVEFCYKPDEQYVTWNTPLRFTFISNDKVLKTWGLSLDIWFDIFSKKEIND